MAGNATDICRMDRKRREGAHQWHQCKSILPSLELNMTPFGPFAPAMEYAIDAFQRSVLFWDVMRHAETSIGNTWRKRCRMSRL